MSRVNVHSCSPKYWTSRVLRLSWRCWSFNPVVYPQWWEQQKVSANQPCRDDNRGDYFQQLSRFSWGQVTLQLTLNWLPVRQERKSAFLDSAQWLKRKNHWMEGSSDWSFRRHHRPCRGLRSFRWGDSGDQMSRRSQSKRWTDSPLAREGARSLQRPMAKCKPLDGCPCKWTSLDRISPAKVQSDTDESVAVAKWVDEESQNAELTPPVANEGVSFWSAPNGHWRNHWMEVPSNGTSKDTISSVVGCALSDEAMAATKWDGFLDHHGLSCSGCCDTTPLRFRRRCSPPVR